MDSIGKDELWEMWLVQPTATGRAGIKLTVNDDGIVYKKTLCPDMDADTASRVVEYVDSLREALAAAEAECAASRVLIITGRYHDDYGQAMQANDATRARLGLNRIGEAR